MSLVEEPMIVNNGKNHPTDHNASKSIQKTNHSKSIVLCFDGTENEFGPKPFTNVLKLFQMLDRNNSSQICYYQPGIKSKFNADINNVFEKNFTSTVLSKITNRADSLVAFTLEKHVIAAYSFLTSVYKTNDKIYLFGFRYVLKST